MEFTERDYATNIRRLGFDRSERQVTHPVWCSPGIRPCWSYDHEAVSWTLTLLDLWGRVGRTALLEADGSHLDVTQSGNDG